MRIVMANKYWYLHRGAERYVLELSKLLVRAGHEVVPFAMRDPKNEATPWDRFFVSPVRTGQLDYGPAGWKAAGRMLWSFEAAKKFSALAAEAKPDILHAHNLYHQLSPSPLAAARKLGIPAVMTIHDYHLISPDYLLFDGNGPYDLSREHPYLDAVRRRAVMRSLPASAWSAFKSWAHRALRAYDGVSTFIAPSDFAKRKHVEYGIAAERIEVIPHFIDLAGRAVHAESERRVVFVGSLSPEKGAHVLVKAMRRLSDVECVIVGDGPDRARLQSLSEALGLKNLTFTGRLTGSALEEQISRALAVVVPSVVYEVFGLAALEAYALGKPVVAANIGGLPEVVRDGETGLLFEAGNFGDLAEKISRLVDAPDDARAMGLAGRALAEGEYGPEKHLEKILDLYRRAIRHSD